MKLPAIVPDGFLQALPEDERKRLGRAGITSEQAAKAYFAKQERDLQCQILNWLNLHRIYNESDRFDKRTSGKKGRADFRLCINGLWLSVEVKIAKTKLRKEQKEEALRLIHSGGKFVVVRSLDALSKHVQRLMIVADGLAKDSYDYRQEVHDNS